MPKSELMDLAVAFVAETDKAWLVDDGGDRKWVPKSQCELDRPPGGGTCTLTIPLWLAKEKGFV